MMDIELINGDCKQILHKILSNYDTNKIIIVTDPPFNIGYHYNTYKDRLNEDEYFEGLGNLIENYKSVIIHYPEQLYKLAFQIGKFPERIISWVYNSNTAKQHRDIAFFGINPNMNQVKQPYKNPNDKRIKQRIAEGKTGAKLYDWWNINQVKNVSKDKTAHPCQMPIKVMENIIGILPYDSIIVDPFMGSGTTGLAVKNMNKKQNCNRSFIGIEIDEKYYEIVKARMEG